MVSQRAFRKGDAGLVGVELIEPLVQGIDDVVHGALGVQLSPGVSAGVLCAGLQDHHESVCSLEDLLQGSVGDLVVLVLGWLCGQVDGLMGVGL